MRANGRVEIGGISFSVTDYSSALSLFDEWVREGTPRQVCAVTVHSLVNARRDLGLRSILCGADLTTMDGEPIRWYANVVCGLGLKERVCGPELMLRCTDYGVSKGWKHFLMGSTREVLDRLTTRMAEKFSGVQIVGTYSPPFRPMTEEEDRDLVSQINAANPDFLWVGLGAPKQERWIYEHLDRVNVPVQVGVGAAFDFHSGNVPRAPKAWQRLGLEWLYRAFQDRRLWRRYLTTNPVFLCIFIRDFLKFRLLGMSGCSGTS
jgi:N-acetylglucosaminyldiphosphoundecaprenol N-acetyl-beta-D-mannosaminyltransferase